jgi:nucleoside-diphosphate-sugar epimerase
MAETILVLGANGQIGTELILKLREIYGVNNVVASDIREANDTLKDSGPFSFVDVMSKDSIRYALDKIKPTQIYHLAAMLSAVGEQKPRLAWDLNIIGLLNVLDFSLERGIKKVYWPSSIAVFGPNSPQEMTPQYCTMDPNTVYGISKLAGERLVEYYNEKYNMDVRGIRYPGIISWKSAPGGGTTDYAIDIFHHARKTKSYECYLQGEATLPMMYMDDAIDATLSLMDCPKNKLRIKSSYNVAAVSFNPEDLTKEIKKHIPDFTISYKPDNRQKIAASWPKSIKDNYAREDWGWKEKFRTEEIVSEMLANIK